MVPRRGRENSLCARGASLVHLGGPSTSPLEVAMEQFGSAPWSTARARRLRIYRLLANSFGPLLAVALLTIVLRWTFPPLLLALVVVWMAVAGLLVVLAVPWLLVSWGFAFGAIKCPSCGVAFAPRFTLWVPKNCRSCGYDVNAIDHRRDF